MPSTLPVLDSHNSEYGDCDSSYSEDTAPNVTLAFIGCPSSHTEISLDFETKDSVNTHSSSEVFYEFEQRRRPDHAGHTEAESNDDDSAPPKDIFINADTDQIVVEDSVVCDLDQSLRNGHELFKTEKYVVQDDFKVINEPQKISEARQPLYSPLERGDAPCRLCTAGRTSPISFPNDGKVGGRSPRKISSHSKRNPSLSPCEEWPRKRSDERAGEGKTSQRTRSGVRVHKSKTEGRHADEAETGSLNFPVVDHVDVASRTPQKVAPRPKPRMRPRAQGDTGAMDRDKRALIKHCHSDGVEVDLTHAGDMDTDVAVAAATTPNPLPGAKQQSRGHPNIDKMFKDVLRILIEQSGPQSDPRVSSIYDEPVESNAFNYKSSTICSFGFHTETSKSNNACALSDAVVSDEGSDVTDTEEPASETCVTMTCVRPQSQSKRHDTEPNPAVHAQEDITYCNRNCHHYFEEDEEWDKSDPEPSDSDSCGDSDESEGCMHGALTSSSRENLATCRQAVRIKAENFMERVSAIAESSKSNRIREKNSAGFQGGEGEADGEVDVIEEDHLAKSLDSSGGLLTKQRSKASERVNFSRNRKEKCLKSSNLSNTRSDCDNSINTNTLQKYDGIVNYNCEVITGTEAGKNMSRDSMVEITPTRDVQGKAVVERTESDHSKVMPCMGNLPQDNIEIIVTPASPRYSPNAREIEATKSPQDGPSNLKVPWVSFAPLTKRPQNLPADDQEQESLELMLDKNVEEKALLEVMTDANDSKSFAESTLFADSQSKQGILSACLEKARAVIRKVRARSVSPAKLFSKLNRYLSKDKDDVTPMRSLSELYDTGENHEPCKMIIHKSRLVEFQTTMTRSQREERSQVEEPPDQQLTGDAHPPIFCLNLRNSNSVKMSAMRIPRYDPFRTTKRTSIGEDARLRNPCSPALQGHRPIPVPGRVLESNALSCAVRSKLLATAKNESELLQAPNTEMQFQEYNHRRSAFRQYRENNGTSWPQVGGAVTEPREKNASKLENEPTESVAQTVMLSDEVVGTPEFESVEGPVSKTNEQQCVVIEGIEGERSLVIQGSLSWSDIRENEEVSTHDDVSSSAPIKTHSLLNVSETAHTESCVNDVMAIISQEVSIKRYPSFPDLTDLNDDDPGSAAGRDLAVSSSPLPDIEFDNDANIDCDTSPLQIKTQPSPISAAEVQMLKISQRRRESTEKLSEEEGYEKLTPPNSPHLGAPISGVQVQTMVSLLESCSVLCGETENVPSRNFSTVSTAPHVHQDKLLKPAVSPAGAPQAPVVVKQLHLESDPSPPAVVNHLSLESDPTPTTAVKQLSLESESTSFSCSSAANEQETKLMSLPSPPSCSPSQSSCSHKEAFTERVGVDLSYVVSTSKTLTRPHVTTESCRDSLEGLRAALTQDYNMLAEETSSACGNVNTLSEQRNLLDESDVSQFSQFADTSEAILKVHSGTSVDGLISQEGGQEFKSADDDSRGKSDVMPETDIKSLNVMDGPVKICGEDSKSANQVKVMACTLQNESIFKKIECSEDSSDDLIVEDEASVSSSEKTSSPKCCLCLDTHSSSADNCYWQEPARLKRISDLDQYSPMTQHARSHSADRTTDVVRSPILSRGEHQRTPLRRIKWSTSAYPEDDSEQVSQSSSFSDRSEEFGISETTLKETKREASLLESLSEHHPIVPTCEINGPPIEANPKVAKAKNKTKRSTSMIDKVVKKKPANKSNLNNNVSMLSVFGLVPLRKILTGRRTHSPMEYLSKTSQSPVVVPDEVNLDPKSEMMKTSYVITPVSQIIGVSYAEERSAGNKAFDLDSESKEYQLDFILPGSSGESEDKTKFLDEFDLLQASRKETVKQRPGLYLLPPKAGTFTSDPRKSNPKKALEGQENKTRPVKAVDKPTVNVCKTNEKPPVNIGDIVAPPRVTRKLIATNVDGAQPVTIKKDSPKSAKGSPEFSFSQPMTCSPRQYCLTTSYSLPLVAKKGANPVHHQQPRLGHGVRPSRTMTTLNRLSERIQRSELQAAKGYDFVERSHFHMERCEKLIRRSSEIIKNSQLMISSSKKRMENTAKIMNLSCKRYFLC